MLSQMDQVYRGKAEKPFWRLYQAYRKQGGQEKNPTIGKLLDFVSEKDRDQFKKSLTSKKFPKRFKEAPLIEMLFRREDCEKLTGLDKCLCKLKQRLAMILGEKEEIEAEIKTISNLPLSNINNDDRKVDSLEYLFNIRRFRRSVVVPTWSVWKDPKPAAFMMNLSGEILLRMFNKGMYLYEPKRKVPKGETSE